MLGQFFRQSFFIAEDLDKLSTWILVSKQGYQRMNTRRFDDCEFTPYWMPARREWERNR